jgi:transposase
LPRIKVIVDHTTFLRCKGEPYQIGEDRSERLDIVPPQARVAMGRTPKYACRVCENGIMQAQAPARLIEDGLPSEAIVAQEPRI